MAALPEEGRIVFERARQHLVEIDLKIERLDRILARLQPPITGRVRVSWRKDGEKQSGQSKPCLVRWKKQGDVWRSERLGLKSLVQKAPKTKAFYNTREEIREATRELALLLKRRTLILESIANFERSMWAFNEAGKSVLTSVEERIDDLEKRALMLPCTWKDGAMEEAPPGRLNIQLAEMDEEERAALIAMIDAP